jgi:farnesyl-diphosphate farnesyltransferase
MKEYMERGQREEKLRLLDVDDLERYCYFVAGTVGELLTSLFEGTMPNLDAKLREEIHQYSVSFGLGLQMVNIVKDVATDYKRGDCFLPQSLADEYGISLDDILDPKRRKAAMSVVQAVCRRARFHLKRAEKYTALWPVPEGKAIRLFCTVPLALALATLKEVEEGTDTLIPERTPKVSREIVARVVSEAQQAISANGLLSQMLTDYAPTEQHA